MIDIELIIKEIIIERLELTLKPEELDTNMPLYGPQSIAGGAVDSLAVLEIVAALSDHFQLPMDDLEVGDFRNISSLADYLRQRGV